MQGKRVSCIFPGKQRKRKDYRLVILYKCICTATGLLVLQLKEKGCCHWFTHATPSGLDEEQCGGGGLRLRLRRRHASVDENNSRSTAISNNRNFAILLPSMVVSKLAREEEQKKKKRKSLFCWQSLKSSDFFS